MYFRYIPLIVCLLFVIHWELRYALCSSFHCYVTNSFDLRWWGSSYRFASRLFLFWVYFGVFIFCRLHELVNRCLFRMFCLCLFRGCQWDNLYVYFTLYACSVFLVCVFVVGCGLGCRAIMVFLSVRILWIGLIVFLDIFDIRGTIILFMTVLKTFTAYPIT